MTPTDIRLQHFTKLQKICSEVVGVEESDIRPSTNFFDDLGVSMEELAEIMAQTAQAFGITINKHDITEMNTLGDLLEFIEEQL